MTDEKFEPRPVEKIEFDKNYGAGLFQSSMEEKSYDVVLRYSCADEYWLTKKLTLLFFYGSQNVTMAIYSFRFQIWSGRLTLSSACRERFLWLIPPS